MLERVFWTLFENLYLSTFMMLIITTPFCLLLRFGSKKLRLTRIGTVNWLIGLYVVCALRMLLPVNFGYAKEIEWPGIFSTVYYAVMEERYYVGGMQFSIGQVLFWLWLGSTFFLLARFGYYYLHVLRRVLRCEQMQLPDLGEMNRLFENVRVYQNDEVPCPICIGFLYKCIFLPKKEYTEDQLYYILLHECTHLRNHDLLIKQFVRMCRCYVWWNPLIYVILRDLDRLLEIRCDMTMVQSMQKQERAAYLRTLTGLLQDMKEVRLPREQSASAFAKGAGTEEMVNRFRAVAEVKPPKKQLYWKRLFFHFSLILLFLASYSVQIVPAVSKLAG